MQKPPSSRDWDIGLNPMASGGGSSLKLPDYMANGLPSLNTPIGARGFPIKEERAWPRSRALNVRVGSARYDWGPG